MKLYHGTDEASAARILSEGFDVDALRRSDPGDFGWGVYLTSSLPRARAYGSVVLEVEVDESRFARLPCPYFLDDFQRVEPETEVERLFYSVAFDAEGEMLTIHSPDREGVSKAVAKTFLEAGYDGLVTGPGRYGDLEVVVFRVLAASSPSRCPRP